MKNQENQEEWTPWKIQPMNITKGLSQSYTWLLIQLVHIWTQQQLHEQNSWNQRVQLRQSSLQYYRLINFYLNLHTIFCWCSISSCFVHACDIIRLYAYPQQHYNRRVSNPYLKHQNAWYYFQVLWHTKLVYESNLCLFSLALKLCV